jgi:hypothetical protein
MYTLSVLRKKMYVLSASELLIDAVSLLKKGHRDYGNALSGRVMILQYAPILISVVSRIRVILGYGNISNTIWSFC